MFFFLIAAGGWSPDACAFDAETLPAGVRMTQAKFGVVSGLDETWQSDGKLYNLGDTKSISFDAATLAKVNDRARALVEALDYFGTQGLGDKINLGTLEISTKPEVQYFAPVFAYGLNDRWTIALGAPVVHYSNRISLSAGQSNLDFYRNQFSGISHQLDAALNVDLVAEAEKVLAEKGYRPLENRDEQFLGDLQLALLHRLPTMGDWSFVHQIIFGLPTGPKDDPDDLMALDTFGRASVENTLIAARAIAPRWAIVPYASLLLTLPDHIVKRVPRDEDDAIPDPDSKQDVARWITQMYTIGGDLRWNFIDSWDAKVGTEASYKAHDQYAGNGRMDLLAKDSDESVVRVRGGAGYSTVDDYRKGRSKIPSRVSIEVSDMIYGRNLQRELKTEMSALLFF